MARRVFFSFHYQKDIWRVNQIRNVGEIVGTSAAGFHDSSLWEEAKGKGDASIKALIDAGLQNTSVTVVCIGPGTAGRKYVNYEIARSIARGNGLLGIQLYDTPGPVPAALANASAPVYKYVGHEQLGARIEEAAKKAGK